MVLGTDGSEFYRIYRRFNAGTIVRYLRPPHKEFGRIVVVLDRAPQHTADAVAEFLEENRDVRVIELPRVLPSSARSRKYGVVQSATSCTPSTIPRWPG